MSNPLTPSDLQQPSILRAHRREWKAERIGWVIIGLVLLLALLGGFGDGPLAHATRTSGSATIRYERLVRHGVPTELRIQLGPGSVVDGRTLVTFDRAFLAGLTVTDIQPTPRGSSGSDQRLTYEFAVPQSGGTYLVFRIRHEGVGSRSGRLTITGGVALDLAQYVFP